MSEIEIRSTHEAALAENARRLFTIMSTSLRQLEVIMAQQAIVYPAVKDILPGGMLDTASEAEHAAELLDEALRQWQANEYYGDDGALPQCLRDIVGGASR